MVIKDNYLTPELVVLAFDEQDELYASEPWYKENEISAPTRPRP